MSGYCALVVTYNRPKLLLRCLGELIAQSLKLNAIIIVDNGSTAETMEGLAENDYIDLKTITKRGNGAAIINYFKNDVAIHYCKLESNRGPGYAFYYGVKLFFEMNFEWLWMMDDDGYPDRNCLRYLDEHKSTDAFLNALVIDEEIKEKLAFGLFAKRRNSIILTKEDAEKYSDDGVIIGAANPFNGTLVSRNLVNSIGFPHYQMYGWGVEVEYEKRASKNGFLVATIVNALHFHPKGRVEQVSILNGRYKINLQSNELKNYIDIRNNSYLWLKYGGKISVLKLFTAYTYFFVTRMEILGYLKFLKAFCHGILGHWGYENKYLK